jgi:SAM-dependent methyltransferase
VRSHPFGGRWNHNAHRYPAVARTLAEVRRVLRPGGVAHLLGYGRSAGPLDALAELRDVLAHRWYRRRTVAWDAGIAVAGPTLTWAENRRLLRRELPGGRYRRLALWRFRYVWRAAGAQLARRVR